MMIEIFKGDWVSAKGNGIVVTGYVEEMLGKAVIIRLVDGEKIKASIRVVEKMDDTLHAEDLDTMIDFSLIMGDEEWFRELSELKYKRRARIT
ncbi:IDEAL domain-containing protein [Bacillus siamensis]|uniref:IDEAL domain-containing protein n=1 Tax=Bacillus siamensis TaxID=659243 RepID=UPI003458D11B|nr:IDEAL domain-containing protein [Pseudomonas aeruginosa]